MLFRALRVVRAKSRCAIGSVALCVGCASGPQAYQIRFAEIGVGGLKDYTGTLPLVVEFDKGDRLPVELTFTGAEFELVPAKPKIELIVKRHCFVRFDEDGIHVSQDGKNFDEKPTAPGSFRVGLKAQRGDPTKLEVVIVAPKR